MGVPEKLAVVMIHGMGEQQPMQTLRGFVSTLWTADKSVLDTTAYGEGAGTVWSKPDTRTGSLELRRMTTRPSRASTLYPDGVRCDFYEFYWADLTESTTRKQLEDWLGVLMLRGPRRVPSRVFPVWLVLWALAALVALDLTGLIFRIPYLTSFLEIDARPNFLLGMLLKYTQGIPVYLLAGFLLLIGWVTKTFLVPYFGDVARYTRPLPDNISIRRDIRARGLELLRRLHDEPYYDRVIIAAHSLGSVIAYDLVSYLWSERLDTVTFSAGDPALAALRGVEKLGAAIREKGAAATEAQRTAYRAAQADFRTELSAMTMPGGTGAPQPAPWLISDLVTFGSPLTHAEFLLAYDLAELQKREREREIPVCPPDTETADAAACLLLKPGEPAELVSYVTGDPAAGKWKVHHAAAFGAVRWTNLYDPAKAILLGDIVGGPLADVFGFGIEDIPVTIRAHGRLPWSRIFTHTKYWTDYGAPDAPSPHITALRKAVDLLGEK